MPKLRVLYVDDEEDIREIVEISLGLDPELWIRGCASGAEALAIAVDWSPDMILCDAVMPVMDGPATLTRLRECPQTVDIPVVFLTSRAQPREIEHFKSLGAVGVIVKPFDPMTLAHSVRSHRPWRPPWLHPQGGPARSSGDDCPLQSHSLQIP
jgi:CheY-like chemotaxis protein